MARPSLPEVSRSVSLPKTVRFENDLSTSHRQAVGCCELENDLRSNVFDFARKQPRVECLVEKLAELVWSLNIINTARGQLS